MQYVIPRTKVNMYVALETGGVSSFQPGLLQRLLLSSKLLFFMTLQDFLNVAHKLEKLLPNLNGFVFHQLARNSCQ